MVIEAGFPRIPDDAVEFRSMTDDAWHIVFLQFAENSLIVTFADDQTIKNQEVYESFHFKTLGEVEDFRTRFRPFCEPASNDDCAKVEVGMTVSVSKDFGNDQWRVYDGVVESVNRMKHEATDMEHGECCCEFHIFWRHGPLGGTVTATKLDNIEFLAQKTKIHPAVSAFLDIAKGSFQILGKSNDRDGLTMSKSQTSSPIHGDSLENTTSCSEDDIDIEFRSMRDDAWHEVSLDLTPEGKLVLYYSNAWMRSGFEEVHEPGEFNTPGEIDDR